MARGREYIVGWDVWEEGDAQREEDATEMESVSVGAEKQRSWPKTVFS